jgi:hypothetical protein
MHAHSAGCLCEADDGEKFSLYRFIDVQGTKALNTTVESTVQRLFRPENEKLGHEELFVESDEDDEDDGGASFILVVRFTGTVRLRKVVVMAAGASCPTEVALYKNVAASFGGSEQPTQVLRLGDDPEGALELPVLAPKFNDCGTISFRFTNARGGVARVGYVGLLGDYMRPVARIAGIVYESAPQMKDHKTRAENAPGSTLGM